MLHSEKINRFLEQVAAEICWKKAREPLLQELADHIEDQSEELLSQGVAEEEAVNQAVAEMGDPRMIGAQLDRVHRPAHPWPLFLLTLLLLAASLALHKWLILPALWTRGIAPTYLFPQQLHYILFSLVVLVAAYCVHPYWPLRRAELLCGLFGGIFFLWSCYRYTSGWGDWRTDQFTNCLLVLLPLVLALLLYRCKGGRYRQVLLCSLFLLLTFFLASGSAYFSCCVFSFFCCAVVITIATLRNWFSCPKWLTLLTFYLPPLLLITWFLFSNPYAIMGLLGVLHPLDDALGSGYVTNIVRDALAGAQWWGQGTLALFPQQPLAQLLPEIHTDYLLTYCIHRFGWVALTVLSLVLAAFILLAVRRLRRIHHPGCFLLAATILTIFWGQFLLYLLANLGLPLLSPLSLPLLSYGRSLLYLNMGFLGLLFAIFRYQNFPILEQTALAATFSRLQWQNGRLIIDFRLKHSD